MGIARSSFWVVVRRVGSEQRHLAGGSQNQGCCDAGKDEVTGMPLVPGQCTTAGHVPGLHRRHVAGNVRGHAVRSGPDAALTQSRRAAWTVDPQGRITAPPRLQARLALDERAGPRGAFALRSSSDRTHVLRLLLNLLFGDPVRRPRRGGRGKGGHSPAALRRGAPLRRPCGGRHDSGRASLMFRSCFVLLRLTDAGAPPAPRASGACGPSASPSPLAGVRRAASP